MGPLGGRRVPRQRWPPQDHRPGEGREPSPGGTIFAPKYIENKLKFSPYIKEAVCFGQDRSYVTALINIDLTSVGDWAERRNLAYTSYMDLSQKPEVNDLISLEMIRVNQSLLEDDVAR